MATTLITGGTGFIGSYLARRLVKAGDKVVLFDLAPDRQAIADFADDVEVVRGDVTLLTDLLNVVRFRRIERIAHCAYIIGPENETNPPLALQVNCVGNNNIWEVARLEGLQRVVWTSSVSLYGRSSGRPELDEDDPCWPTRVYGSLKLFNENLAEHYFREFGVEHIAVRPSSVYGPGRLRGSLQFMVDWITTAAVGGAIRINGADEMDNWSYVDDVAGALAAGVLTSHVPERRIFNIGGDFRSRREFGNYVQSIVPDAKVEMVDGVENAYRPRHRNSNIAEALGFRPEWSMEHGVLATVNATRERAGLPPVG